MKLETKKYSFAQSHEPITIKGKPNDAVLISREDWEAIAKHNNPAQLQNSRIQSGN